jgi:hypothetical protein
MELTLILFPYFAAPPFSSSSSSFSPKILTGIGYTPGSLDTNIETLTNNIYNAYISNASRCMANEVRAEENACRCVAPPSSGALYGRPCDPQTKTWVEDKCIFSRCKV